MLKFHLHSHPRGSTQTSLSMCILNVALPSREKSHSESVLPQSAAVSGDAGFRRFSRAPFHGALASPGGGGAPPVKPSCRPSPPLPSRPPPGREARLGRGESPASSKACAWQPVSHRRDGHWDTSR